MRAHDHRPMDERPKSSTSLGARDRHPACRRVTFARNDLLFTMSDNTRMRTSLGRDEIACANSLFSYGRALEPAPSGLPSRSFKGWWSQTESNRRPPACKAGALPTELWPRAVVGKLLGTQRKREWWAWEDLNFRPHAYQARALTN
jgi:hypothetical protein